MSSKLLTKAEFAERLGVPESTVSYWVKKRLIPFVQPGGVHTKPYLSSALADHMVKVAGGYSFVEPDFSTPDPDHTWEGNDLRMVEPGLGDYHQSRKGEWERYQAARAEGKSIAEAICAAEGLA